MKDAAQMANNTKESNKVKDYLQLVKPSLSIMVVFSSVASYLLVPGIEENYSNPWLMSVLLFVGGMLVTGSANAINQVVEKDTDALMKRTAKRPVAAGRMSVTEGWAFAIICGVAGVGILGYYFNLLSAGLALFSLFLYAFVYTPLKKISAIAVLVGAVPGALPCLIGWTAGANELSTGGWVLFAIQFLWQFPHFWALAWMMDDDYKKAGFFMLPASDGRSKTSALQIMVYTAGIIPIGLLPYAFNMTGIVSAVIIILCGMYFMLRAIKLHNSLEVADARKLLYASFIYLPIVQLALLFDTV